MDLMYLPNLMHKSNQESSHLIFQSLGKSQGPCTVINIDFAALKDRKAVSTISCAGVNCDSSFTYLISPQLCQSQESVPPLRFAITLVKWKSLYIYLR